MIKPGITSDPAESRHGDARVLLQGGPSVSTPPLSQPARDVYTSSKTWSVTRPKTLVVACSDGRLQESIDEFLNNTSA